MQSILIRICSAVLLIGAFWNFGAAFGGVPAFDAEARRQGALGDWRLPVGAAMYDRGAYLFQLGYGFVNVDDTVLVAGDVAMPEGFETDPAARAQKAMELFAEAIEHDPGNASAWTWLAWSQSSVGETALARETLAVSWELAPYSRDLAITRLDLAALVYEFSQIEGEDTAPLTEKELQNVRKDFRVLSLWDEDLVEDYLEAMPFLAVN